MTTGMSCPATWIVMALSGIVINPWLTAYVPPSMVIVAPGSVITTSLMPSVKSKSH